MGPGSKCKPTSAKLTSWDERHAERVGMKTQFTLRQLFVCVTCSCAAFALLATERRLSPLDTFGLIEFFCGFVALALAGTGAGYLFDNFRDQVILGTVTAIV